MSDEENPVILKVSTVGEVTVSMGFGISIWNLAKENIGCRSIEILDPRPGTISQRYRVLMDKEALSENKSSNNKIASRILGLRIPGNVCIAIADSDSDDSIKSFRDSEEIKILSRKLKEYSK